MKSPRRNASFHWFPASWAWLEQRWSELARIPVLAGRVLPAIRLARSSRTAPFIAWLEAHAAARPDQLFCELDGEQLSFSAARERARRVARVLVDLGVQPGDVVALIGSNSPQYLVLLLAVSYAGGVAALINPSLTADPLAHALRSVTPRVTLIEAELSRAIAELPAPEVAGKRLEFGTGELEQLAAEASELEAPRADPDGDFVFIFTSGTTGLPKPCRVRHDRARSAATVFGSVAFEFRRGDKLYCALPLHHSSALLIGVGAALCAGVPIALRRKFSVSAFARDLVRYRATATLYVGDVCRALVHSPATPEEREIRLRVAVGNGMQREVWPEFARRFGNPRIREFYASTEAPAAILNLTGTIGSVGHVPFERQRGFRLARLDADPRELGRDGQGRGSECEADEPGELLLRIFPSSREPHGAFAGYTDDAASRARVARDVFEPGDAYFRSGDVLSRDAYGYFRFVDRLGDGFRWKGENISALEVERVLSEGLDFAPIRVFGVAVPGYPGRAGCAEVVTEGPLDAARFARAALTLPGPARPCFVRAVVAFDLTSSFKVKKGALDLDHARTRARDGEPLWVRQNDTYVVLTDDLWDDLCRGQARL